MEDFEYRVYDSTVLSLYNKDSSKFEIYKDVGCVERLKLSTNTIESSIGLGHTRWGIHGGATNKTYIQMNLIRDVL